MKKIILSLFILGCMLPAFSQEPETDIQVVKLAESSKSWNGEKLPAYLNGQPKITILKITIPAHTKLAMHKHLVINAGVLIKGVLTVVDDKKHVLE